ncbi:MAG: lipoprotein-releasing ABC transporter permease subunit [Neisseriaceae bacterium]|nr:lipoprotein-releasing ABC transporter permease subunit [Neisseriaceae bacterium]
MFSLETRIGLRYLRAKKRNGFMSFISVISVLGIMLGVMTLIVVLSVMNGFQRDVRAKLFEIAPHLEIGYTDPEDERPWQNLLPLVGNNSHVIATAPYVSNQALITNAGDVRGAYLQGIEPLSFSKVADTPGLTLDTLQKLNAGEFNIILGADLAEALSVNTGDRLTVLTPHGNVTPAGMVPRIKQFNVVEVVPSDIYEISSTLALIHMNDAQKLFRMGEQVTGVRIKLDNPEDAPELAYTLSSKLQRDVWIRDWSYQNRSYFEAVAMEKKMMVIIMALISLVASFNLVSSLVMTVNEKRSDIAILRTLGLAPSSIMKIFMVQGAIAGFFGTLFGVILGVVIAKNITVIVTWIERLAGRALVDSQVYFLNYIPSDIQVNDVAIIAFISLLLAFVATLYPAWSAAKTEPAEALRYE